MAQSANIMRGGLSAGTAQAIGGTRFASIAAAGSAQGDGTAVTSDYAIVTAADGTKGVTLPAAQPGDWVVLENNSASTLKVYPPSGAAISVPGTGLGSANAAYSHTTYAVVAYFCVSSTQWFCLKSA